MFARRREDALGRGDTIIKLKAREYWEKLGSLISSRFWGRFPRICRIKKSLSDFNRPKKAKSIYTKLIIARRQEIIFRRDSK